MAAEFDHAGALAVLFGRRVRRLRESMGWTQEKLGTEVRVHSTRITQIERARGHVPTLELATALDAALNADGQLLELWPLLAEVAFPDWREQFMHHAARATALREYAAHSVPGLLQTEDYARALLRVGPWATSDEVAKHVARRMRRQERLREPDGPTVWAVLDEAVLRRPVGGPAVMRAQLARLREAAADPKITLQVLRFDAGEHPAMGGSLTLLTMPGDEPDVAYTEGSDYGRLVEDANDVRGYELTYDQVLAHALPPNMSLRLIATTMEDLSRGTYVAEEHLQQPSRRKLRGGRRPRFRRRPGSRQQGR